MRLFISKYFLYITCVLAAQNTFTYIYQAQHLFNESLQQHILLFSDYHEESAASTIQRIDLLDGAIKNNAYLLVEDQSFLFQHISAQKIIAYLPCLQPFINDLIKDPINFDANKLYNQDFSIIDPEKEGDSSPLYLLTHIARQRGINASTVECRQAEIISTYGGPINATDVFKTYDKILQDIELFDDGSLYTEYYHNVITQYKERVKLIHNLFSYLKSYSGNLKQAYLNKSFENEALQTYIQIYEQELVHYYQNRGLSLAEAHEKTIAAKKAPDFTNNIYEKIMNTLYLFLVDTKIIHEIAQHKSIPLIIVYAGGAHIDETIDVLRSNGYTHIDEMGGMHNKPISIGAYFTYYDSLLSLQKTNSLPSCNALLALLEKNYQKNNIIYPLADSLENTERSIPILNGFTAPEKFLAC